MQNRDNKKRGWPKGQPRFVYDRQAFAARVRDELGYLLGSPRSWAGFDIEDKAIKALAATSGIHHRTLRNRVLPGRNGVHPKTRQAVINGLYELARERGRSIDVESLERLADLSASNYEAGDTLGKTLQSLPPISSRQTPPDTSTMLDRRTFLGTATGLSLVAVSGTGSSAAAAPHEATARRLLAAGHAHMEHCEYEHAVSAFARFSTIASTDEARALANASRAHAEFELNRYDRTRMFLNSALADIGFGDLPPSQDVTPQAIESRLQSSSHKSVALETYGVVAKVSGLLAHIESDFEVAERAFNTRVAVGNVLGDRRMQADGWHHRSKSVMEQGSVVRVDHPAWRLEKPDGRSLIARSVAYAEQALKICPNDDGVARAIYQRVKARGLWLQGDFDSAFDAEEAAQEGYHNNPQVLSLYIDRGRMEVIDGDSRARSTWLEALQLARAIDSSASVAAILGSMAHPDVLGRSSDDAKALAAASLLAWPIPVETRDSVKSIGLYQALEMNFGDVRTFLAGKSPVTRDLLEILWALPGFDGEAQLTYVERRLHAHQACQEKPKRPSAITI